MLIFLKLVIADILCWGYACLNFAIFMPKTFRYSEFPSYQGGKTSEDLRPSSWSSLNLSSETNETVSVIELKQLGLCVYVYLDQGSVQLVPLPSAQSTLAQAAAPHDLTGKQRKWINVWIILTDKNARFSMVKLFDEDCSGMWEGGSRLSLASCATWKRHALNWRPLDWICSWCSSAHLHQMTSAPNI